MKLPVARSLLAISSLACALSLSMAAARAEIVIHDPVVKKACSSLRYRRGDEAAPRHGACKGPRHARLHAHPHRELRTAILVSPPPRVVYADLLSGGAELGLTPPQPSDYHLDPKNCEGIHASLLCPGVIMYGTAY